MTRKTKKTPKLDPEILNPGQNKQKATAPAAFTGEARLTRYAFVVPWQDSSEEKDVTAERHKANRHSQTYTRYAFFF